MGGVGWKVWSSLVTAPVVCGAFCSAQGGFAAICKQEGRAGKGEAEVPGNLLVPCKAYGWQDLYPPKGQPVTWWAWACSWALGLRCPQGCVPS